MNNMSRDVQATLYCQWLVEVKKQVDGRSIFVMVTYDGIMSVQAFYRVSNIFVMVLYYDIMCAKLSTG